MGTSQLRSNFLYKIMTKYEIFRAVDGIHLETIEDFMETKKKNKVWSVLYQNDCGEKDATVKKLADELEVSELTAKLLFNRGYENAEAAKSFLENETSVLHDPFKLADVRAAIERIKKAMDTNERIVIYGDYDVDGTTAVALVYKFLQQFSGCH